MSTTVTPIREDVTVTLLGTEPTALQIIDQVVAALESAGDGYTADAFLRAARGCDTEADLLRLARCTVTVL